MKRSFVTGLAAVAAAVLIAPDRGRRRTAAEDRTRLDALGKLHRGRQDRRCAIAAFMKEHGDTVAGRKVVIIKRDDGGNAPDTAKRLAQELIVSEHVDFLMGLVFSPNAKAVGDVSTSAKIPTFITNAASNGILEPTPTWRASATPRAS